MTLKNKPWVEEVIEVNVELVGNFTKLYYKHKPKGMSDDSYVNSIISSWLLDKESNTTLQSRSNQE